jgi:gliding motility-associated-like protein
MRKAAIILFIFFSGIMSIPAQRLLPADTVGACVGDTLFLYLKKNLSRSASVKWITPYASIYNTPRINVTRAPGKYYIQITENGRTFYDSTFVVFYPRPALQIPDTTLCWGKTFTWQVNVNPLYKVKWSNGKTDPLFSTRNSGTYWVEISIGNCVVRDSFTVRYIQPEEKILPDEVRFCLSEENKTLTVKADPEIRYEWSNGILGPTARFLSEGKYYLKTFHPSCGYRTDSVFVKFKACDCEILIPNSFSPNDDNKNDYFFPVLQCDYVFYQLTIFDKFGNVLFHTNNPQGKWDGKYKGIPCEEDIYVYKLETIEKTGEKKQSRSGRISLIR